MEHTRVSFATLGCKLNLVDTEEMTERLIEHGYRIVPFGEPTDIAVINTCTVTGRSDFKSRRLISQAHRANPHARIVVTGCYAQLDPQQLSSLPGVSGVLGPSRQHQLPDIIEDLLKSQRQTVQVDAEARQPMRIVRHRTSLSRAFLRVQHGCDQRCTFCRVWRARGRSVSEPLECIMEQAKVFLSQGFQELVLTGVDMGSWGRDLPGDMDFGVLLERLSDLEGTFRIRLSSIYPMDILPTVFRLVTSHPKVCRHLHLPLQSGSQAVLRRMGRHVSPEEFMNLTWRLRNTGGRMGIGADIIAGFPGESEADFLATKKLIENSAITYLHVFPFSPRRGTRAADFPDQLPPELIKARSLELRELGIRKRKAFRRDHEGPAEILVERRHDRRTGLLTGFTSDYLRVCFEGPKTWMGSLVLLERLPRDTSDGHVEPRAVPVLESENSLLG